MTASEFLTFGGKLHLISYDFFYYLWKRNLLLLYLTLVFSNLNFPQEKYEVDGLDWREGTFEKKKQSPN